MSVRGFQIQRSNPGRSAPATGVLLSAASLAWAIAFSDSTARAATITVSATDCQRLVQHQPAADVAYTPGVDVNGNPVAPADLPGSVTIRTPTEVTFEVTYDLLSNYGVAEDSLLAARGEASIGTVKYDLLSGVLTFNGERLDDPETAALADLCRAAAPE